ncbi:cell adhesion protein [Ruminococcus sp. AF21-42]|nr:cell adhesion protein [Ruminococcus sp. AF21-42]
MVSVTSAGVITAKAAGTAKITVKSGSKKAVVTVTVLKTVTKSISGIPSKQTLKKGKSITWKVKLNPSNSDDKITYTSSNKKVAAVDSKGKITAKGKGTAIITVKSGKVSVKCKITVK